jgi:hypothetical protein
MYQESDVRVSELLLNEGHGDPGAREKLIPLAYGGLRRTARRHSRQEDSYHTLQNGARLHESNLRLPHEKPPPRQIRPHFFGVASQFMPRTLVDYGRTDLAARREWATARAWLQRDTKRKEVHT